MSEVFRLPRGTVAYNTLLNILKGYLRAGAEQKYVGSGEVAEKLGMNKAEISRNVKFFVDFGFLEREKEKKRGGCKLVTEVAEFAGSYKIAPASETARRKLGKILRKHQVVETCLKRLESGKQTSEELSTFILEETADHNANRYNLDTFIGLLIYGVLLKQKNDYFVLPTEGEIPELPKKVKGIKQNRKRKPDKIISIIF